MELLDNELQKITNTVQYNQLLGRVACLYDATTDAAVDQLLSRHNFTFEYMHSGAQSRHIARVTAIYRRMLLDRLERLLQHDQQFTALMQLHYPQRLEYLRQVAAALVPCHDTNSGGGGGTCHAPPPLDDMAHGTALVISVLMAKHHLVSTEAARFVRLYRRLALPSESSR